MEVLGILLIGLLAGWLANVIVRGSGMGLLGNIIVGVLGAVLGGYILGAVGIETGIDNFFAALIGAVLLLLIVGVFQRPSTSP